MSRGFLTAAERERLSTYPEVISPHDLGRFFTLTKEDLACVSKLRGDHNRLGFALQLCTLRYLGFIPDNLLDPPSAVIGLLAYQLKIPTPDTVTYGERDQTHSDHLQTIMQHLHYYRATPLDLAAFEGWLVERALEHDKPLFLLHTLIERLHWDRIFRPGLTVLERMVARSRQQARHVTFERMSHLLSAQHKTFLDGLLEADESSYRTTLGWLQRLPNDHTASQINTTLEKIRFLQDAGVINWDLREINPNRLKFLANLGGRSSNQHLQRSVALQRYPILIAFLKQSLFDLTDVVIDLVDARLWQIHNTAKNELNTLRLQAARSTNEKLRTYFALTQIIIDGTVPDGAIRSRIFDRFPSDKLQQIVAETESLIRPVNDEAIDLFAKHYSYIRRFAPAFLANLTFQSHKATNPLLDAVAILKQLNASGKRAIPANAPTTFISPAWQEYVIDKSGTINRRYYELAVLWELRLHLRSGRCIRRTCPTVRRPEHLFDPA